MDDENSQSTNQNHNNELRNNLDPNKMLSHIGTISFFLLYLIAIVVILNTISL